jgi:hypothetical protein
MTRRNQARAVAAITIALAAAWTAAMAQTPELDRQREYWRQQEEQRQEQQRRAQEEFQRQQQQSKDKADQQQRRRSELEDEEQQKQQQKNVERARESGAAVAKNHKLIEETRARLLRTAALAPDRNPLLGRWRVASGGKPRGKDDLSQLMGMLSNMDGAACEMLFGEGITEFQPKSWASIDRSGTESLGPIQYRMDGNRFFALPDKGMRLLGFEVVDKNRIREVRIPGCVLVRVDSSAAASGATPGAPPATSRAPAPSSAAAAPPTQMANAAPAPMPSTLSRPSPEVCRQTLLDKLGTVGVNQVRAMSDVRFKEVAIEGKVPNTNNLRIDLRGSACDDPRIKATLYDFDANGMLQSITYVWARPAGPAPAPIFQERVATLSRFHSLPPPQSPSRLQADTSMGRLILEDLPERNLLLEAYKTQK